VSLVLIGFKSVNMTVVSLGYRCSFGKWFLPDVLSCISRDLLVRWSSQ
jgi:hypothetical protein